METLFFTSVTPQSRHSSVNMGQNRQTFKPSDDSYAKMNTSPCSSIFCTAATDEDAWRVRLGRWDSRISKNHHGFHEREQNAKKRKGKIETEVSRTKPRLKLCIFGSNGWSYDSWRKLEKNPSAKANLWFIQADHSCKLLQIFLQHPFWGSNRISRSLLGWMTFLGPSGVWIRRFKCLSSSFFRDERNDAIFFPKISWNANRRSQNTTNTPSNH